MPAPTFAGIVPPVMTPFTENGELDVASLESLIRMLIDGGVHGLFVLGSAGEVAFLTDEQRTLVVTTAVRVAEGRVPVLTGVNDMSANRVLAQIQLVEAAGAQAIVATAPFYILPSVAEVEAHFRILAASTTLPIFAYDAPGRVHRRLDMGMLIRLGLDGVIAGVKDSSGDDASFRRLIAANRKAGSPLSVFTGQEVVVDGALMAGADGVVPGLGNVDPHGYTRMLSAAKAGDWERVRVEQDRLAALREIVFQSPEMVGEAAGLGAFKTALVLRGVIASNVMSRPIPRIEGDAIERIRAILDEVDSH